MTRDEAIQKAVSAEYKPGSVIPCTDVADATRVQKMIQHGAALCVDRLVALGLLKLDEPMSVENDAMGLAYLLFRQGVDFKDAGRLLADKGFKIVKA